MPVRRLLALPLILSFLAVPLLGCGGSSPSTPSAPAGPAACPNAPTGTFTVNSGETIRLAFTTSPVPTADFMVTSNGLKQASGTVTWTILNGTTVLGTARGDDGAVWKSSTSLFASGSTPVIDFSSIVNGTVNGRAELSVSNGSATFDLSQARIVLAHATSSNGFTVISNPPVSLTLISSTCR